MDAVLPFAESLERLKESFLWAAAKGGHAEDCLSLLEYGADVDWISPEGDTALIAACRGGHSQVVELLLSHGAEIDQQTPDGTTALHCCVQRGDQNLAKLLLEAGCSTTLTNARGQTAHAIAVQKGLPFFAILLQQYTSRNSPANQQQQQQPADDDNDAPTTAATSSTAATATTTTRQRDVRRVLPRMHSIPNFPQSTNFTLADQQQAREQPSVPIPDVRAPVRQRHDQEESPQRPTRSARASRLEAEHLQEQAQQLQQENEKLRARIEHYQGNSLQGLTVQELEHLEHELRHAMDAVTKRKVDPDRCRLDPGPKALSTHACFRTFSNRKRLCRKRLRSRRSNGCASCVRYASCGNWADGCFCC